MLDEMFLLIFFLNFFPMKFVYYTSIMLSKISNNTHWKKGREKRALFFHLNSPLKKYKLLLDCILFISEKFFFSSLLIPTEMFPHYLQFLCFDRLFLSESTSIYHVHTQTQWEKDKRIGKLFIRFSHSFIVIRHPRNS